MIQRAFSRSFRHALLLIAFASAVCVSLEAQDKPRGRGPRKPRATIKPEQPPSLLDAWIANNIESLGLRPFPLLLGGTPIVGRASMVINSANSVAFTKNFIGTTCDADIGSPTLWQPSSAYLAGDHVRSNTGVRAMATNSGTSGASQPAFNPGFGGTTTDGTITWQTEGTTWQIEQTYTAGMVVQPATGGRFGFNYVALNTGLSLFEPVWPTTAGATVFDGGVTWKAIGFYPGTFRACDPMQIVMRPSSGPDATIAAEGDAVGAAQLSGWSEFIAVNSSGKMAFRTAIAGQLTDEDENGSSILTAGPGAGTLTKISSSGDIVGGRPICGLSAMVGINDAGQVIYDAYNSRYPAWRATTGYASGSRVIPTVYSGLAFRANGAGVSGATEPAWPTTPGRTVADGSITWTARADTCDENNHGLVRFTPGPGQELLVALGSSVGGSTVVGFGNDVDSAGSCSGCRYDDIDGLINSAGHVAVVLRLADGTQGVFNFTGPGSSTQIVRTSSPSLSPRISINNLDQVAFKGVGGGVVRISRFTPPDITTTVVSVGDDVGLRSGGAANGITFASFGDFFDLNNSGNLVFQAKLSGAQEGYYFWNGATGLITEILRKADTNSLAPEMISINDANVVAYVTGTLASQCCEFSANDAGEGHETGGVFFWNAGTTSKAIAVGDVVGGSTVTALYAQHRSFVRRQVNQSSCIATAYTIAGNDPEMDCSEGDPRVACYSQSPLLFVGCLGAPPPSSTDLAVTKSGPATVTPNSTINYTITVTNNGPAVATNVQLTDPTPAGLTFVSASGSCVEGFPCSLGNMTVGQSITVTATFRVQSSPPSRIVNIASVSSSTPESAPGNNSAAVASSVISACPSSAPSTFFPANGATNIPVSGMLTWNDVGSAAYNIFLGVAGSGCSKLVATRQGTSLQYGGLDPATTYEWRVETASGPGCPAKSSPCLTFTTGCANQPPFLISPLSGTLTGETTFSWTAVPNATEYHVFVTNGSVTKEIGKTTTTSLTVTPPDGTFTWYVVANFSNGCPPVQSNGATLNVCSGTEIPTPSVVAEATTGQIYTLRWFDVFGASRFEVDEALNDAFIGATTQTVIGTSIDFQHTATVPTAFFYRVRAFSSCVQRFSGNSLTMRVVVIPVPPLGVFNPNIVIPVGSKRQVVQQVFVPGTPGTPLPFTATVDKPWLQVSPSSGMVPPEGIALNVTSDPTDLPNGTLSGTVLVTIGSAKTIANGTTSVSIPISINLVTPVTPVTKKTPASNARIIPSVGNVEGLNSRWQSDVRIANTSGQGQAYDLIFVPGGDQAGAAFVNQTTVQVDSGGTLALDDIVRNWYGVGSLSDRANGILEIIPHDPAAKTGDAVSVSLTTFVSSKTYNLSASGTLPQFVPAVAFANLISGPADPTRASILGLQQIAQSDQARTNLGLVEAANLPASVVVSAFDASGKKLLDLPIDLKPSEQRQINSFLAQNNIFINDGRLEVKVIGGDGLVTAYASVIDPKSGDPLLVSGTALGKITSNRYVIPGVADLNSAVTSWRTDARVFNSGSTAQAATLTFFPEGNTAGAKTASVNINPGEVKELDNILQSTFGVTNAGGVVHVTTASPSAMVVTARTFNQTSNGTLGQFIPAVTPGDAVGVNDRALQILQLEESARYRTNLGLAEVGGKPVVVEVSLVLPDSKVSPKTQIPLGANEFRQFGVIRDFGLSNVYNARIAVRVISGDGAVTAYGSIVDQKTQAPSYVPAQ